VSTTSAQEGGLPGPTPTAGAAAPRIVQGPGTTRVGGQGKPVACSCASRRGGPQPLANSAAAAADWRWRSRLGEAKPSAARWIRASKSRMLPHAGKTRRSRGLMPWGSARVLAAQGPAPAAVRRAGCAAGPIDAGARRARSERAAASPPTHPGAALRRWQHPANSVEPRRVPPGRETYPPPNQGAARTASLPGERTSGRLSASALLPVGGVRCLGQQARPGAQPAPIQPQQTAKPHCCSAGQAAHPLVAWLDPPSPCSSHHQAQGPQRPAARSLRASSCSPAAIAIGKGHPSIRWDWGGPPVIAQGLEDPPPSPGRAAGGRVGPARRSGHRAGVASCCSPHDTTDQFGLARAP